jgi:tetratricopeptide (TPR) repeat protein
VGLAIPGRNNNFCSMYKYFLILFVCSIGSVAIKAQKGRLSGSLSAQWVEYNSNYSEGTKQKLLGNKNQAILCFFRCIELNPKSSGAFYQLAEIYTSALDFRKAIYFSNEAYKLDKKNPWYLLQLAQLYQNVEALDTSATLYAKLIHLAPGKEEYYLNLSFLYFKLNKPQKSLKILNGFQNKYGVSLNSSLTLYQIYKYVNDNKNCLRVLHRASAEFPDETRFYGLLAEHFISMQQMDSALFYYRRLLSIDPENDKGILSIIEYYKANHDTVQVKKYFSLFIENPANELEDKYELFSSFINDANYRRAFSYEIPHMLDSLIRIYPKNQRFYLLKGDYYLRNNDLLNAKPTLIYIVKNLKSNYFIWEQLLFTLHSLSQYTELLDYSKQAMVLFGDKPVPYLFAGMSYYYLKNYDEGIPVLIKGLTFVKQSKEYSVQFDMFLGECFHAIKDYKKSDFYFEKVLQYDPQNLMVLNNYSYYLASRNDQLEKALNYIQVCIQKYPNSSTYLDTYGWILFRQGNYKEAKIIIEKALQYGGANNMEIIEHYSEILFYNGDKVNAIKFYKIIEENGKSNPNLKKLLQID